MKRSFEEGLMCGLFMDYNNKTISNNYKRLSDPVLEYILNNATLNLEIELTSHYIYKRYYGYIPRMEDPNRELFVNFKSTRNVGVMPFFYSTPDSYEKIALIYREGQIPRNENGLCLGQRTIETYECSVWFRDDIPIVAYLYPGDSHCLAYYRSAIIYTDEHRDTVKEIVGYPDRVYDNIKCDEIPYLGKYKQTYDIYKGKIRFLSIDSIPDFSVNVTWDQIDSNYISVVRPNGDYTVDPKVSASSACYETETYTLFPPSHKYDGTSIWPLKSGLALPFGEANTSGLITDLTIKEYNECQMELINQIYAENNTNYEFVRIKDYILLDELKPDKLPPELRYTT